MTKDELNQIEARWRRVAGENIEDYRAHPEDLSDKGFLIAFDIPRLIEAAKYGDIKMMTKELAEKIETEMKEAGIPPEVIKARMTDVWSEMADAILFRHYEKERKKEFVVKDEELAA